MGDKKNIPLPVEGERNILITSALPYVNNVPHLGNIIGCVLSGDVFARYCRLRGYNVLYICGTDEYGTTTEVRSLIDNLTPREICEKFHPLHKHVYHWFGINFDHFGRTSTPQHTQICHQVIRKLSDNQLLSEDTIEQLYCEGCSKFLADRLVEGQCPHCSQPCKGDQCEDCGGFINARDLLNPVCKVCQSSGVSLRTTEHLFFQLPSLQEKLHEYCSRLVISSQEARAETRALLSKPLAPKCFTRDLKWGVPIPLERFMNKVLYVWYDAPLGYVSITKCLTSEWEQWWKNPDNVELHQFMGKDNVTFHSVHFPSMLIGTGDHWTLPTSIHATQFLLFGTGKFSKSRGLGVFGDDVKETGIPVEVWRYYLLAIRPEVSDTVFSWEDLQAKLNSELVDNLGNLINRVLTFVAKPPEKGYDSFIPDASGAEIEEIDANFGATIGLYVREHIEAMEKAKLKIGLAVAMKISKAGNQYLQVNKIWELYRENSLRCALVVKGLVGTVCILACLLEPFMPSFTTEVLKQLDLSLAEISIYHEKDDMDRAQKPWDIVPSGHKIGTPRPLFRKLKNEEVEALKSRYSGSQTKKSSNDSSATKSLKKSESVVSVK